MDFLSWFVGGAPRARVIRAIVSQEFGAMTKTQIAKRAGVATPVAAREIRALAKEGVLKKVRAVSMVKKKKGARAEEHWALNPISVYARALSVFVREVSPAQYQDIELALKKTGRVSTIILSGVFVGDPTRPADLLVAGDALNEGQLERVVRLFEPKFGHEIRYAAFTTPELRYRLTIQDRLLRDILDFPHRTILNKGGIV